MARNLGITHDEARELADIGGWVYCHVETMRAQKLVRAKVISYDGRGRLTVQLPGHRRHELADIRKTRVWRAKTEEIRQLGIGA